ncbi:hypothetical protein Scep_001656 [Stephania cephalantha]|uniref:Uncharacterized protein n=1 Tax=Stephania cephalantha TaxID=152367 RepID=A0AAP0Q3Z3_9MAGN
MILVPRRATVLAGKLRRLLIGNQRSLDEKLMTLMRDPEHMPQMYKGGNCLFTRPPCLQQNLLHRIQAKKIGNKLLRKKIPLNKKVKKRMHQEMEMKKMKVKRVRWAVDVVTAWKAFPSSEGDKASALKMADEVLKHLAVIGAPGLSGTPTSSATQSQHLSNLGDGGLSKRKGKAPSTSQWPVKKSKN